MGIKSFRTEEGELTTKAGENSARAEFAARKKR